MVKQVMNVISKTDFRRIKGAVIQRYIFLRCQQLIIDVISFKIYSWGV